MIELVDCICVLRDLYVGWDVPTNESPLNSTFGGQSPPYSSMRNHGLLLALITVGVVAFAAMAFASEPFGRLAPYWRTPTPYYVGNPKVIPPKKEAPPRTAQYARTHSAYPHAYPYGYFGAQTRPYSAKSLGYYENADQTTYGWGY